MLDSFLAMEEEGAGAEKDLALFSFPRDAGC